MSIFLKYLIATVLMILAIISFAHHHYNTCWIEFAFCILYNVDAGIDRIIDKLNIGST